MVNDRSGKHVLDTTTRTRPERHSSIRHGVLPAPNPNPPPPPKPKAKNGKYTPRTPRGRPPGSRRRSRSRRSSSRLPRPRLLRFLAHRPRPLEIRRLHLRIQILQDSLVLLERHTLLHELGQAGFPGAVDEHLVA